MINEFSSSLEMEIEGEEPVFIEVLLDCLLSLLIRPSILYREISKIIFYPFIHEIILARALISCV